MPEGPDRIATQLGGAEDNKLVMGSEARMPRLHNGGGWGEMRNEKAACMLGCESWLAMLA
ncbi:hypothetical protein CCR75_002445 [Bremia lactucae]|uniref:Uncharacterized protein n=1 Tax=Bremia lactucae TaxID=4779 RepID=A0A976ID21_BRELC|nr:hypothetical protein CCR75_002445 [Bremia lactucae]